MPVANGLGTTPLLSDPVTILALIGVAIGALLVVGIVLDRVGRPGERGGGLFGASGEDPEESDDALHPWSGQDGGYVGPDSPTQGSRGGGGHDPVERATSGTSDVSALGEAAGAAADRIESEDADADNEVYRAWSEMAHLLEVGDPQSSTPGEVAEVAIRAGMDESHVEELRRLFEEVRYGGRDPASREERAIEILRAIEAEYGSE